MDRLDQLIDNFDAAAVALADTAKTHALSPNRAKDAAIALGVTVDKLSSLVQYRDTFVEATSRAALSEITALGGVRSCLAPARLDAIDRMLGRKDTPCS